jgi:hypothetical protein
MRIILSLLKLIKLEMYCYFVDKRPQNFQYHGNKVTWEKRSLFMGKGSKIICGGISLQLYLVSTKDLIWSDSKYNGLTPDEALELYPLNLEHKFSIEKVCLNLI